MGKDVTVYPEALALRTDKSSEANPLRVKRNVSETNPLWVKCNDAQLAPCG